ncbi:MAG: phosphate propanoyltransferase [Hornefia sp.]|nr:phosphate propanoyltransferase [Hornefia sp.]
MNRDIDKMTEAVIKVLQEKGIDISSQETEENDGFNIPVGVSNRHIHLSREDLEVCFGRGYRLTPTKELSQTGQFACKETVTVVGPKGSIERIRVLGPVRAASQVELLSADNFKLGIKAPVRLSGNLKGAADVTIVGPCGSVYARESAIVAKRHIHMTLEDAKRFGVCDGEIVSIEVLGERGGVLNNVIIRANDKSKLDCHVDTEEANALGLSNSSKVKIVK